MIKRILLGCSLLITAAASAQTNLYVDSSAAASGSGTSWATAYKTLNEALNVANAASTTVKYSVNVAKGTYYAAGVQTATNRDSTFYIVRGGIKVLGGYPNGGGTRNTALYPTVLSGNIGAAATNADNAYHVLIFYNIAAGSDTSMVDGFRITGGTANGTGNNTNQIAQPYRNIGGGIVSLSISGPAVVSNSVITGNTAVAGGGGSYAAGSKIIFNYVTFTADSSAGGGGAMLNESSGYPAIYNCSFSGNIVPASAVGAAIKCAAGGFQAYNSSFVGHTAMNGGAIWTSATNGSAGFTISGCTFTGNSASGSGGAVYAFSSSSSYSGQGGLIRNSIFTTNTAATGGAVYVNISNLATNTGYLLRRDTFTTNQASGQGGAVFIQTNTSGSATIDSTAFTANKAATDGGGMCYAASGTNALISMAANTFMQDTAARGGGLYATGISSTDYCKFYSNTASYGAGLYIASGSGYGDISNSIFSGNTALLKGGGATVHSMTSAQRFHDCIFSGNTAGYGGGAMFDTVSSQKIYNCTFAGDSAINGNGIYNNNSSPTILNTIVWEGTANSFFNINNSLPVITYSTVAGGYTGTGNISTNPMFIAPLTTAQAPAIGGNYQLLPCSPAINAGSNTNINNLIYYDILGNPRIYYTVDQGPYEYQFVYPPAITTSGFNNNLCASATVQLANTIAGGVWSSSNTAMATVDANGLVSGVITSPNGPVTITYTVAGPCPFSVTKVLTIMTAPPYPTVSGSSTVCLNGSTTLIGSPGSGYWYSALPSIATVTTAGTVTGVALGTDTIFYSVVSFNGCATKSPLVVTVTNPIPLPALTGGNSLCLNSSITLSNAITGGTFSSSNTNSATVGSTSGVVTGVGTAGSVITYSYAFSPGCTSTTSLPITVNPLPFVNPVTGVTFACQGSAYQLYSTTPGGVWSSAQPALVTVNQSGVATAVSPGLATIYYSVTDGNGCTGAASRQILVGPTYNNSVNASICDGSVYILGNQTLTTAGTYSYVYQTQGLHGCDSNVTLHLSVNTIDATITQTGNTLSVAQAGATYQWIDCSNNGTIAGATGQTFTPLTSGNYAVIITQGNCGKISDCKTISGVGIPGINNVPEIHVYPNPATNIVTVATWGIIARRIVLRDMAGKPLMDVHPTGSTPQLNVAGLAAGIYIIEVYNTSGQRYTNRVTIVR